MAKKINDHWPAPMVWSCHRCGRDVIVNVPVRSAPSHWCQADPPGLAQLDPFPSPALVLDLGAA